MATIVSLEDDSYTVTCHKFCTRSQWKMDWDGESDYLTLARAIEFWGEDKKTVGGVQSCKATIGHWPNA